MMTYKTTQEPNQNMPQVLHAILQDMDICISEQESIIFEEREAMKVFNAEVLSELVERRARSQSTLNELESRCQRMMSLSDSCQTMEQLIDSYAADHADELQSMRIELMRRMQILEKDHVENHLRLRAAWNVTTSILQQVGVIEVPQTYRNTSYTQQATR
ncbi:MAG: hypothetical protein R8M46_04035 [Ghiorsea sp.]